MIELMETTKNVPGDVAEFGIHRGRSFVSMAKLAQKWGKVIHGIDSFEGMPEPGKHDGNKYPKGKFGNSSIELIRIRLDGTPAELYKGFVPGILEKLIGIRYSFIRIDLDHHLPTALCMEFVWLNLNKDGIMCVHDYFRGRDSLASKAISEFGVKFYGTKNTLAWWRK